MENKIVFETLKQYFHSEISNNMIISKDYIKLVLSNGKTLKISTKEKA